ncbi:MAG: GatB/YqeY domain-containing protein [Chloroflexi bacterium]|nr:GatB/YqeY domain-containing protein [Chloroflexota bacterium]
MPTLAETLRAEMTAAMRARDTARRDTLRLLIAALDNARIAAGHELSDEESVVALQREARQRRDSIEEYGKGGRADLVASEQAELEIISAYLPEELTEEELSAAVDEVIAEVGASGAGELGKVMGPLMERVRGRADGRHVTALVRERLAGD